MRDERDTRKQRYIHSLCITIILPEVSNRKEAGLDVLRERKQQKRKGKLPTIDSWLEPFAGFGEFLDLFDFA